MQYTCPCWYSIPREGEAESFTRVIIQAPNQKMAASASEELLRSKEFQDLLNTVIRVVAEKVPLPTACVGFGGIRTLTCAVNGGPRQPPKTMFIELPIRLPTWIESANFTLVERGNVKLVKPECGLCIEYWR